MTTTQQKRAALLQIEAIIEDSHYPYSSDEVALNELFNNITDGLCKDGALDEGIYNEWVLNANERYALLHGNVSDLTDFDIEGNVA